MLSDARAPAPVSRFMILRETLISAVINSLFSALFFAAIFGFKQAPAVQALGRDCLPQAFMVALMGSLVPGLILRRHSGKSVAVVVRTAVLLAIGSLLVFGGGACAIFLGMGATAIAVEPALIAKIALGAAISIVVTPIAVLTLFRPATR